MFRPVGSGDGYGYGYGDGNGYGSGSGYSTVGNALGLTRASGDMK